jgi:uncharacterized membrane protein YccC
MPALINAARAIVTIGTVEVFWIATAWPNGAFAMFAAATMLLLLSPRGDLAFGGSIAVGVGIAGAVVCAAVIKFAVLPAFETFPALCAAIGLFLIPAGFVMARSVQPAAIALMTAMGVNFMALLSPTNPMTYNTVQYYNTALSIIVGCVVAPLAFSLLPPLGPAQRARRLLAFALRDLRRLAVDRRLTPSEDWEGRMYGRIAAVPDAAEPLQRARLLAALSVGTEIIQLRHMAPRLGVAVELNATLAALAQGNSATAIAWLHQLDQRLASGPDHGPQAAAVLRARSRILVISEALSEHASYFDAGALA